MSLARVILPLLRTILPLGPTLLLILASLSALRVRPVTLVALRSPPTELFGPQALLALLLPAPYLPKTQFAPFPSVLGIPVALVLVQGTIHAPLSPLLSQSRTPQFLVSRLVPIELLALDRLGLRLPNLFALNLLLSPPLLDTPPFDLSFALHLVLLLKILDVDLISLVENLEVYNARGT